MENIAKNRLQISIAFNIILIIMTLIGFYMCLQEKGRFTFFRFYTEDSNLLSMLVCIIYVVVGVIQLKSGITDIPKWVQVLKYITTSCLMVTFTVVVLVLAPLDHMNYKEYLFTGSMFFYHFLCPLITIMTFILFDYGDKLDVRCKM